MKITVRCNQKVGVLKPSSVDTEQVQQYLVTLTVLGGNGVLQLGELTPSQAAAFTLGEKYEMTIQPAEKLT